MTYLWLALGLALLVAGAELLVRGAARLAAAVGLSPMVIGLTVVAWGTSAPEAAVTVEAALKGHASVALGNVLGSNIANILLILGSSAALAAVMVTRQTLLIDAPVMAIAAGVVHVLAIDGHIGRWDGALLFLGMIVYTTLALWQGRRVGAEVDVPLGGPGPLAAAGLAIAGLVLLLFGAERLVESAVTIAKQLGMSDLLVGLTIVAIGTSLPELATSVIAALRGQREIAVGNVVGSNIANLLLVLALAGLLSGDVAVPRAAIWFDLPVMTAVSFAVWVVLLTGRQVSRVEGFLLLAYYAAYLLYLVLASTHHDELEAFTVTMLAFVLPATVATLLVGAHREWVLWRARRRGDNRPAS